MTVHNFAESLAKSHAQEEAPWWREGYRKAFPGFLAMHSVRQDGWAQRGGIDRKIILASGKTVDVDEKVREKDWPDILLERWSDQKNRKAGWIQKDLACDYIAYAFIPSQVCYVFPFLQLRMAWIKNGREWIDLYQPVLAENEGYVTESIRVPIGEVVSAVEKAMTVQWHDKGGQDDRLIR